MMMMQDIAMHILDIGLNCVRANATEINITFINSTVNDLITFSIIDNGCGMNEDVLSKVIDPFYTSRTTRRVGLGIPLIKAGCEMCEGSFFLESKEGHGTKLVANFKKSHLDTPPVGNLGESLVILMQANENINFCFNYQNDKGEFSFKLREITNILEDVSILEPSISIWLKDYLNENIKKLDA